MAAEAPSITKKNVTITKGSFEDFDDLVLDIRGGAFREETEAAVLDATLRGADFVVVLLTTLFVVVLRTSFSAMEKSYDVIVSLSAHLVSFELYIYTQRTDILF